MDDTLRSCREFTAVLASAAPTPGGGGAAALNGFTEKAESLWAYVLEYFR